MFSTIRTVFIASCLLLASASLAVQAQQVKLPGAIPAPEIDAKAWAVMEFNSGWIVAGENIELKLAPASITKLMTNYVVFAQLKSGEISLQDEVTISEKSWRAIGSRMFAEVGSKISLEHLLKSTIIQSGNDAAIALAEHVAGSELAFAALMNRTAKKLNLQHSSFANSTGLPDDNHYMSAQDILKLSAAIIRDFPEYYAWYAEKEYTHNNITQYNRNKLLWKDSTVDGLKTGHTDAAGYCLVASSEQDGARWLAVVLGAANEKEREKSVLSLLRHAYLAYEAKELFTQQGGVTEVPVYKGEVESVYLKSTEPVHIVLPVGTADDINTELQISPYYEAPIAFGQPMGVASVTLQDQHLVDVPLVSMSDIDQGGLWLRLLDSFKLMVRKYMDDGAIENDE